MTSDACLEAVCAAIDQSGLIGLAWIDDSLRVTRTFGSVLPNLASGAVVTDILPVLVGLEEEIASLRTQPDKAVSLPAVGIGTDQGQRQKVNFTIRWDSTTASTVIIAHQSQAQTDIEVELSRQMRARLIAEAELKETAQELARANRDLENFAALISHDLKAPLRHMRLLIDQGAQEIASGKRSDVADTLNHIGDQARRMNNMLNDLFEYSLVGRKYDLVEPIELRKLAESIAGQFPNAHFNIEVVGNWPKILSLRAPLTMVLTNLVANAIQHHDRGTGMIEIACVDRQNTIEITVSDDGPGIDAKHQKTVFLPFRSLNPQTTTAQSGMGLAMVWRAVELIGGDIALISDPEARRGSKFVVSWPKSLRI